MCKLILDESDAKTCAPSTPRFCNAMCKRRGAQLAFFDYTRNSEHVTFKHHAQRAEVTSMRCSLHATAYEKKPAATSLTTPYFPTQRPWSVNSCSMIHSTCIARILRRMSSRAVCQPQRSSGSRNCATQSSYSARRTLGRIPLQSTSHA